MKIEQLRIGNYYNYFEDTCKGIMIGIKHSSFSNDTKICMSVESDSVNGTNTIVSSGWIQTDLEGLKPIPLTVLNLEELSKVMDMEMMNGNLGT